MYRQRIGFIVFTATVFLAIAGCASGSSGEVAGRTPTEPEKSEPTLAVGNATPSDDALNAALAEAVVADDANNDGVSPLDWARQRGRDDIAALIAAAGGN